MRYISFFLISFELTNMKTGVCFFYVLIKKPKVFFKYFGLKYAFYYFKMKWFQSLSDDKIKTLTYLRIIQSNLYHYKCFLEHAYGDIIGYRIDPQQKIKFENECEMLSFADEILFMPQYRSIRKRFQLNFSYVPLKYTITSYESSLTLRIGNLPCWYLEIGENFLHVIDFSPDSFLYFIPRTRRCNLLMTCNQRFEDMEQLLSFINPLVNYYLQWIS